MSDTINQKMRKAKAHIELKQWDKARAILAGVDHPTAKKWLAEIDRISPVKRTPDRKWVYLSIAAVLAVALIVGVGMIVLLGGGGSDGTERMFSYCLRTATDISTCSAWRDNAVVQHVEVIAACHRQSPELDAPFEACLTAEGIRPR